MKNIITFLITVFTVTVGWTQSTEKMSYQSIIRDVNDAVIANTQVSVKVSILQGSNVGTTMYEEIQTPTTNNVGLITMQIGNVVPTTGDLTTIDWSSGPYFMKIEVDPTGGTDYTITGTSEILTVPYAMHSKTSDFAESADYNTLLNRPTIITAEQITKIDLITVTTNTNLDQMGIDITANNAKVSFPGFGTVPGTALEGDTVIWSKADVTTDIFYNSGNVGIGVDETSSFGGAKLHVGGGILFDGIPAATSPGTLYYDNSGTGAFRYVDETNTTIALDGGTTTYNGGMWTVESGDATIDNDVIIQQSLAVGTDAVNGENFGFNTIILKENNTRLLFDDTNDPTGTFPANDWQLEANESRNGGTSHFAILDITGGTTPFKVLAGAPTNSIYVSENGNVGIGTSTPSTGLEVNGNIKANSFIGDGSGLTGIATGTGGVTNTETTIIAADTNGNNIGEIALQTQNATRVTITNDGKVGIGTQIPSQELEVAGTAKFQNVIVDGSTSLKTVNYNITDFTDDTPSTINYDVTGKSYVIFNSSGAQIIDGFASGTVGQKITITTRGNTVNFVHNSGTATQPILLSGGVDIVLNANTSASFIYDGTSWYCIGLSN